MVNNKKYIGQSIEIYSRWKRHINNLNKNKHHNRHLQRAWIKYGEDNFKFYIIEECLSSELDSKEKYYISLFNTMDYNYGYNMTSGGNQNVEFTEELKKRIGETRRGKLHTPEVKAKMSEDRKGEKNSFYGKHHSEETRKKMCENHPDMSGHNNPRFNPEKVVCLDTGEIFMSAYDASIQYGLYSSSIKKCCTGKLKSTGGMHFQYYDELNECAS